MEINDHTDAEYARCELAYEMGEDTAEDKRWFAWCSDVESLLSVPTLDGDDATDGYSLDEAHSLYANGAPPREAAAYFAGKMEDRR